MMKWRDFTAWVCYFPESNLKCCQGRAPICFAGGKLASHAWPGTPNTRRGLCAGVYLVGSGCKCPFFQIPPHAFQTTFSVLPTTQGVYRLSHEASLYVEHLPPTSLTTVLQGDPRETVSERFRGGKQRGWDSNSTGVILEAMCCSLRLCTTSQVAVCLTSSPPTLSGVSLCLFS